MNYILGESLFLKNCDTPSVRDLICDFNDAYHVYFGSGGWHSNMNSKD